MTRLNEYLKYHENSARIGDIDPSYSMLEYICNRFELNTEQRYWLAFLYATTYCGATVFYIYNEFPDFENVNTDRMTRWWFSRGREVSVFQTDRRWCRSRNQFVDAVESYEDWVGETMQEEHFSHFTGKTPEERYEKLYASAKEDIFGFGQFTLFLYLEALHTITPLDLCPTDLDLNQAWSCRNGLYYAYGLDNLVDDTETPIRSGAEEITAEKWANLRATLAELERPPTVWQTETILCAYRKYHRDKRWIGYYLDRQGKEIVKMEKQVKDGVAWKVLWQYREETFSEAHLMEKHDYSWKDWREKRVWETGRMITC